MEIFAQTVWPSKSARWNADGSETYGGLARLAFLHHICLRVEPILGEAVKDSACLQNCRMNVGSPKIELQFFFLSGNTIMIDHFLQPPLSEFFSSPMQFVFVLNFHA